MRRMQELAIDDMGVATLSRRPEPGPIARLRSRPATIVEPKLLPPALGDGHVARPELCAHLEALCRRRLTLITALAGFGKTRLVLEWLGTTARDPVAWVSLDAGDADPMRLWSHIAAAVSRTDGESCDDGAYGPAEISARLLNRLARRARGMVIVLDDHHAVPADRFGEELAPFVLRLPENVRVIVAGRRRPTLPLSLLRARGELAEIGADGEREIEAGVRMTGGWAACLALAVQPDGARHVREYVADEVLADEDPDAVRFLELTAARDELLGAAGAPARLGAVARARVLGAQQDVAPASSTHLGAHEQGRKDVCRRLREEKKQ